MWFYKYKLDYYSDFDKATIKDVGGYVCAESYSDALDSLARYYGEGSIIRITLLEVREEGCCIELENGEMITNDSDQA